MPRRERLKSKEYDCPTCAKCVAVKDPGIWCEICKMWFHAGCQDVNQVEYDFLLDHTSFHWYCKSCSANVASYIHLMSELKQRQEKLELSFDNLKARVTTLESEFPAKLSEISGKVELNSCNFDKLSKGVLSQEFIKVLDSQMDKYSKKLREEFGTLSNEVRNIKDLALTTETKLETAVEARLVQEIATPSFADVISRQIDTKYVKVSEDITKVKQVLDDTKKLTEDTRKMAEEVKDKENRSNNIIIYRAQECDKKEDRIKYDKDFCMELFKDVLEVDVCETAVTSIFRIGKSNQNSNIPRPLLVQFNDKGVKNEVMQSLSKLRNSDTKFKSLSVTHDLTKAEREECKTLVEEAKKKQSEESGEFLYRVRGNPGQLKIIKIRKQ
jgi:ribonuclease HII/ribosomal protein L37AE/L43A